MTEPTVLQGIRVTSRRKTIIFREPTSVESKKSPLQAFFDETLPRLKETAAPIYVLGSGHNARLITRLWEAVGSDWPIYVGSYQFSDRDVLSPDRELGMMHYVRYGGSGWHRLRPEMVSSYALRPLVIQRAKEELKNSGARSLASNKEILYWLLQHPAMPALTFQMPASGHLCVAYAAVAAAILDPRWHPDREGRSPFGNVYRVFDLGTGRAVSLIDDFLRAFHEDRPPSIRTLKEWKLASLIIAAVSAPHIKDVKEVENLAKGVYAEPCRFFVRYVHRRSVDEDPATAVHRALFRYLDFVCSVWLDVLNDSQELFVPEYFFQDEPDVARIWRDYVASWRQG